MAERKINILEKANNDLTIMTEFLLFKIFNSISKGIEIFPATSQNPKTTISNLPSLT